MTPEQVEKVRAAAAEVNKIRADLIAFDGDRRGHYAALEDAQDKLVKAALALAALDGEEMKEWTVGETITSSYFRGTQILDEDDNTIAIVAFVKPSRIARLPALERAAREVVRLERNRVWTEEVATAMDALRAALGEPT